MNESGEHTLSYIDAFLLEHGENPDLWYDVPQDPATLMMDREEEGSLAYDGHGGIAAALNQGKTDVAEGIAGDVLTDRERMMDTETALRAAHDAGRMEGRKEMLSIFFEYVFGNGVHPSRACRNLYALAAVCRPGVFRELQRWKIAAVLLGESRKEFARRMGLVLENIRGKMRKGDWERHELMTRAITADKRAGTNACVPWTD